MKKIKNIKDNLTLALIILATGIGLLLLVISIKNIIDMMVYSECLKQEPHVFLNHPICKKYRDY